MARRTHRRVVLTALVTSIFAPGMGCTTTRLSASKFAEGFIQAKVDKERLVAETCAALEKGVDAGSGKALERDIVRARQHDLEVLARAVCDGNACTLDKARMAIQMNGVPKANALLRSMLREVDKQAKSPEELEKVAAKILADSQAMARILFKLNVARAGVFVALKLGDATQNFSDKLADSFGLASGFARPALELVTSELVAATMDKTFSLVESQFHVPRANFTEEACAIYKRSEPRSNVASFILERAILRYAPREKLDALVAKGIALDCSQLNEWIPKQTPTDDNVCERIRSAVDVEPRGNIKADVVEEEALRALVSPKAPEPDDVQIDKFVAMEAKALMKSADACAKAYPGEREGACTLERIVPVASHAYARELTNQPDTGTDAMRFDDVEQRVAALEGEIVRAKDRLGSDEERMQMHEEQQKELRKIVEKQQERMSLLEGQLLDQRRLVDTILAQDESLRRMSGQMADLAVAAFHAKCRDRHDNALAARTQFAKRIGFASDFCAQSVHQPQALETSTVNGVGIQRATFCRVDLPIVIDFSYRFDTQVTMGNMKQCDTTVRCDDPHYAGLCDSMRKIAAELSAPDFGTLTGEQLRPYRFIGHASTLSPQFCVDAGRKAHGEMQQNGVVGLGQDPVQTGISYLRAKSTADEFGKLVQSLTSVFQLGKHFDLVAAGTTHVVGIGNSARPSDQEAFQKEFQRVSMEIRAPRFMFTLNDCLASR